MADNFYRLIGTIFTAYVVCSLATCRHATTTSVEASSGALKQDIQALSLKLKNQESDLSRLKSTNEDLTAQVRELKAEIKGLSKKQNVEGIRRHIVRESQRLDEPQGNKIGLADLHLFREQTCPSADQTKNTMPAYEGYLRKPQTTKVYIETLHNLGITTERAQKQAEDAQIIVSVLKNTDSCEVCGVRVALSSREDQISLLLWDRTKAQTLAKKNRSKNPTSAAELIFEKVHVEGGQPFSKDTKSLKNALSPMIGVLTALAEDVGITSRHPAP